MEQAEARLKILSFTIGDESAATVLSFFTPLSGPLHHTDLSPYTLCLFRLGLPPGVRSRAYPAPSKVLRAFVKALASTGSDPALLFKCAPFVWSIVLKVGGVLDAGGDASDGVCKLSVVLEATEGCWASMIPRMAGGRFRE